MGENIKEIVLKYVKRRNSEHDNDFERYVGELLADNLLVSPAVLGIGKKIKAEGVESLSESQLNTFVEFGLIQSGNVVAFCERCAHEIPWSEMREALDDHYCGYCRHIMNKDD